MAEFKSGFVSIIGRTNVGKSTLINNLVGEKIAGVANKVQTTRSQIRGIVNRENSQIIFIDTPGVHKPKTKLGETMLETAYEIAEDVDIILFIVDCSKKEITKGDRIILSNIMNEIKQTNMCLQIIYSNENKLFINGTSAKEDAIEEIYKLVNEPINIVTVGDDKVDIGMIKKYDGYRMKNSSEEVKKVTNKEIENVYDII